MKCPNCKKEVPDSAKVCGYCGKKLEKYGEPLCPYCGKELTAKAKVCGYCGTPLKKKKTATVKSAPAKKPQTKKTPAKETEVKTRKLPNWAIPVGLGVAALVLVVVLFAMKSLSQQESAHPPEAERAPLLVSPYCFGEKTIAADRDMRFQFRWLADTGEQAQEFIDVASVDILLDGDPIAFTTVDGPVIGDFQGEEKYFANYYSETMQIKQGSYSLGGEVSFSDPHFDGADWFGPDTDNEVIEVDCELIADPELSEDYDALSNKLLETEVITRFELISDLKEELDEDQFDVYEESISNGIAKISPKGYIHYNQAFSPYKHGTLGLFKFESDGFLIGFEIYSDPYQIWGLNETGEIHFHRDPEEGQTFPLDGDLNWEPDTWYYVFLSFISPDEVHTRVWEKEFPSNMGELYTHFDAPAEGTGEWHYLATSWGEANGDIYVDKFISIYFE